jgi:L-aminopeptidase/D-esterase-like protein
MEILTSELRNMEGVRVGHWTDRDAQTGCTVIRFDAPALSAVAMRGGATGSRELDVLKPGMTVQRADAILLTGGSAFGLAAADGVMYWLRDHNRGFQTAAGPVPIVPAAVIFDLATGDARSPDASSGRAATEAAEPLSLVATGRVGAGTGATLGKVCGRRTTRAGGFVGAQVKLPEGTVTALAVVNAFGCLAASTRLDPRETFLAGSRQHAKPGESTTLLACITDIPLDHTALQRMTVAMDDGLARSIVPSHTYADGDIAFASTVREDVDCPLDQSFRVSLAAEMAVEAAIGNLREHT